MSNHTSIKVRLYVYWFTLKLCWRNIFKINLGDHVLWNGKTYIVSNGVSRPWWALVSLDGKEYHETVNEDEFDRPMSLRNIVHAVRFTWDFYSGYWFQIWFRDPSKIRSWP